MFSSLRARLWLSYTLLIVTALAVVAMVLVVFLVRSPLLYRQTYLRLKAAEGTLIPEAELPGRMEAVAQALNVRVLLFSSSGALIEDTASDSPSLAVGASTIKGGAFPALRDSTGRIWLYSVTRLADGNSLMTAAQRPKLVPILAVLTDDLAGPLAEACLISLLLALVLAFVLARWIADPLQPLIEASRRLAVPIQDEVERPGGDGGHVAGVEPVAEHGPQEVRELTRAFNAMAERVQSSQRSQRDFVANVSHELRTPLTSIQGFAQALMDGAAESADERRRAAEVIYAEAGRMHRMALDLLDLARLDAGTAELKMAPVDLGALLRSVLERFQPMSEAAGMDLTLFTSPDLTGLIGDGDRLAQVFTNLLDNALKFTPSQGSVRIRAVKAGGEIQVSVSDTGQGIATDEIPHVFDRFYQADSARAGGERHGAGLGLAIADEIVSAHGGKINVRSARGRGAEFVVHLPVVGAAQR